mmetsp:Transcript_13718/g.43877  ORF Transcript_13718/g.43877 Transcript_13718/m.43877 type:complete len:201 (-) Transcript_13718:53-655(-)
MAFLAWSHAIQPQRGAAQNLLGFDAHRLSHGKGANGGHEDGSQLLLQPCLRAAVEKARSEDGHSLEALVSEHVLHLTLHLEVGEPGGGVSTCGGDVGEHAHAGSVCEGGSSLHTSIVDLTEACRGASCRARCSECAEDHVHAAEQLHVVQGFHIHHELLESSTLFFIFSINLERWRHHGFAASQSLHKCPRSTSSQEFAQ